MKRSICKTTSSKTFQLKFYFFNWFLLYFILLIYFFILYRLYASISGNGSGVGGGSIINSGRRPSRISSSCYDSEKLNTDDTDSQFSLSNASSPSQVIFHYLKKIFII